MSPGLGEEWLEEGRNCKEDSWPDSSWEGDETVLNASSEAGAEEGSMRSSERSLPEFFPPSSINKGELMLERRVQCRCRLDDRDGLLVLCKKCGT